MAPKQKGPRPRPEVSELRVFEGSKNHSGAKNPRSELPQPDYLSPPASASFAPEPAPTRLRDQNPPQPASTPSTASSLHAPKPQALKRQPSGRPPVEKVNFGAYMSVLTWAKVAAKVNGGKVEYQDSKLYDTDYNIGKRITEGTLTEGAELRQSSKGFWMESDDWVAFDKPRLDLYKRCRNERFARGEEPWAWGKDVRLTTREKWAAEGMEEEGEGQEEGDGQEEGEGEEQEERALKRQKISRSKKSILVSSVCEAQSSGCSPLE